MPSSSESIARQWLANSVAALVIAGLLALLLVVARMPPLDRLVTDPDFFRRCLVVHVVLSLVVWFYSFTAALLCLLPQRDGTAWLARCSPRLGSAGVALLVAGAFVPRTKAAMANYIPMLDHWLFGLGLATLFAGVGAAAASRSLLAAPVRRGFLSAPPAALSALRVAVVGLVLAGLTLLGTAGSVPEGLDATTRYELLFWGCGHVLQMVSVAALLACWQILIPPRTPAEGRTERIWLAILLAPWLAAPLLPLTGASSSVCRSGFTRLMELGLAPAVLAFVVIGLQRVRVGGGDRPARVAFVTSAALTLVGFALGASIEGSTTVVPGHYHANIGAVTVAFMAVAFRALQPLGLAVPSGRLARLCTWQPAIYGSGQLVFALGFAFAGAHGAARKAYGAEQAARGASESVGLAVMGAGGAFAIAGGLLFLFVLGRAWLLRPERSSVELAAALPAAPQR